MKRLLIALLLVSTPLFAQATRDVQKKASRQTANVETISADKTLTYLDAETQLLTPSGANRIVTLPSASVWKAWSVKITNESGSYSVVVKSSDGSTVDTVGAVGQVQYVARQASPTTSGHWTKVIISVDASNIIGTVAGNKVAAATSSTQGAISKEIAATGYTPTFGGLGTVGGGTGVYYAVSGPLVIIHGTIVAGTVNGSCYISLPYQALVVGTPMIAVGRWVRPNVSGANVLKSGTMSVSSFNANVGYFTNDQYFFSPSPGGSLSCQDFLNNGETVTVYMAYIRA